jgi:hypothetical protein
MDCADRAEQAGERNQRRVLEHLNGPPQILRVDVLTGATLALAAQGNL